MVVRRLKSIGSTVGEWEVALGASKYGDFRVYVVCIVAMLPLGVKRIWRFYPDSSPKFTMALSQGSFLCSLLVICSKNKSLLVAAC
jgi:hypothetical protein